MYHSIIFEDANNTSYVPPVGTEVTYEKLNEYGQRVTVTEPVDANNYHIWRKQTFNTIDIFDEWNLVATERPSIASPPLKYTFEETPGADGGIDYTDTLTGYPLFNNSTGSWTFYILNDFDIDGYNYNWMTVFNSIKRKLHGRRKKIFLEDEPDYYYIGRLSVKDWSSSDKSHSQITIDYTVEPYKYAITTSGEDWLWDPFNFETGVLYDSEFERNYYKIRLHVNQQYDLSNIINQVEGPVVPEIRYNPVYRGNWIRMDWKNTELRLGSYVQNEQFKQIIPMDSNGNYSWTNINEESYMYSDVILSNMSGNNECWLSFAGTRWDTDEQGNLIKYRYEDDHYVVDEHGNKIVDPNGRPYALNDELDPSDEYGYGDFTVIFRRKVL